MKLKNKGKVYPSPSDGNVLSVLKLIPATILALISVLSIEDREVLAYMITRSMDTAPPSSITQASSKKKPSNHKLPSHDQIKTLDHKPPMFECHCFDCYTSYWFRWDSSPNRELIHQVIEAFEEHMNNGERFKKNGPRGKKDKTSAPVADKPLHISPENDLAPVAVMAMVMKDENSGFAELQDNEASPSVSFAQGGDTKMNVEPDAGKTEVAETAGEEGTHLVFRAYTAINHRGLARKVLPDVLGLLNSRLWNLWSPNV